MVRKKEEKKKKEAVRKKVRKQSHRDGKKTPDEKKVR